MNETQEKALSALDGLLEINRNEMVAKVGYFQPEISRLDLAEKGAICGGHKACLLGSLWLGAGVPVPKAKPGEWLDVLPGVEQEKRADYLRKKPGLKLAYRALNLAALNYLVKHDKGYYDCSKAKLTTLNNFTFNDAPSSYSSPAEYLFENRLEHLAGWDEDKKHKVIRQITTNAKKLIKTEAV